MLPKDCPTGPKRKHSSRANLEARVVRECLQFLKQCPDVIYVERRNTGAVQFQDGGFIRFGQKGAADIWCLVKRVWQCPDDVFFEHQTIEHVEIECKRSDGKDRQSADQKRFQEFCGSHHIPYILTTSAQHLAEKIEAISSGQTL